MPFKLINFVFLGFLMLFTASCNQDQGLGNEPSITFENYEKTGEDSIRLTIGYKDGNGDLGLGPEHDKPPFDTGKYANNLIIKYYEKFNGQYGQTTKDPFPDTRDTIRFRYRFRNLTPKGDNKAIKGKINVTVNRLKVYAKNFPERDYNGKIRFEVFIYDRALNKSNTVFSPPIPFKD